MIAEVLAALGGHAVVDLSSGDKRSANPSAAHPSGEDAILAHLLRLAARYTRVRRFANTQLEHARLQTLRNYQQLQHALSSKAAGKRRQQAQAAGDGQSGGSGSGTAHLIPLCQTILAVLREYERLVLDTERKVIHSDSSLVAAASSNGRAGQHREQLDRVSLAALRSIFELWERPLANLEDLVDELVRGPAEGSSAVTVASSERTAGRTEGGEEASTGQDAAPPGSTSTAANAEDPTGSPAQPARTSQAKGMLASTRWTGGQLIDMLVLRSSTSLGPVHRIMQALLSAVETSFMRRLQLWLCRGEVRADGGSGQRMLEQDTDALVEMAVEPETEDDDNDAVEGPAARRAESSSGLAGVAQHLLPGLNATQTKHHGLTFLERRWRFRTGALPSSVSDETAQNMLTVGRVLSAVRVSSRTAALASSGKRSKSAQGGDRSEFDAAILSPELYQTHTALLQQADIRPSHEIEFAEAMQTIREDVCEWLWQNVLTIDTVVNALQALGDYALQRNGSFALAFQTEVDKTRRKKLLSAKNAAGAALQISDLDMAFHRASLGSSVEDDPALERFYFTMPKVKVRRTNPRIVLGSGLDASVSRAAGPLGDRSLVTQSRALHTRSDEPARFDDLLLGVPVQLHYTVAFPLDLFLSPMDLAAYSRLFSFLAAMRRTQTRVLECWKALSHSQRIRRRFTGTGEGGVDKSEEQERKALLRKGWGLTRKISWFLDTVMGHFQTDIIEVQYTRLIAQLQSTAAEEDEGRSQAEGRTQSMTGMRSRNTSLGRRTSINTRRRVSSTPSRPSKKDTLGPPLQLMQTGATSHDASPRVLVRDDTMVPVHALPESPPTSTTPAQAESECRSPASSLLPSRASSQHLAAPASTSTVPFRRASGVSASSSTGVAERGPLSRPSSRHFARVPPSRASTVIAGGSRLYHFPSSTSIGGKSAVLSAVGAGSGLGTMARGTGAEGPLDVPQRSHLDFNSLQATHSAFLAFVLDGLLLSSTAASGLFRAILELCDQFVGIVERWGGDVVPDLLSQGSLQNNKRGSQQELNKIGVRRGVVETVSMELDDLLTEFFRLLSGAGAGGANVSAGSGSGQGLNESSKADGTSSNNNQKNVLSPGEQTVGSLSLLSAQVPLARADQTRSRRAGASGQLGANAARGVNQARLEADVAARRHLEQLLLRLDFNYHFTERVGAEEGEGRSLGLPRSGSAKGIDAS
ncbi:hypothetical protein V8E36_003152 [Tilletia maclaganii]